MSIDGDLPAQDTSTTATNARQLAQRVIAAVGQGRPPADPDILAMRSLAPTDADQEDENSLQKVPLAARKFFESLVEAVSGAGPDKGAGEVARLVLNVGAYDLFDRRRGDKRLDSGAESRSGEESDFGSGSDADAGPEPGPDAGPEPASDAGPEPGPAPIVHTPPQWTPHDLFVLRAPDGQDTRVRDRLPYDDVPGGLEPSKDDPVVTRATSLDELATIAHIDDLPVVTLRRVGTTVPYVAAPLAEDVSQGGDFGDCWLLALFAAVARNDPGLLRRVLPPDVPAYFETVLNGPTAEHVKKEWGEGSANALAFLWRDVDPNASFVDTRSSFSLPQAFELTPTFARQNGHRMGALSRAEPSEDTWMLREQQQHGGRYVEHVVRYRVITWPALLEKAFALYIENFGEHGNSPATAGAGYGTLAKANGLGQMFLRNLYGPRIHQEERIVLEPLRASLTDGTPPGNEAARCLQALLKMNAQTRMDARTRQPGTYAVLMMTSTSYIHVIGRLQATLLTRPEKFASAQALAQVMTAMLQTEQGRIRDNDDETPDPVQNPPLDWDAVERQQAVNKQALNAALDDMLTEVGAELTEPEPAAGLSAVGDLLLTLRAPRAPHGDDSTGKRFLYCEHDYAVLDVALVFTGEGAVAEPENVAALSALIPRLDPVHSTITLYNPHGQNSANTGQVVPGDTGRFTLTLDRFLNVAHKLNYTTVIRE